METDLAILFDVAVHLTDKEARKQAQAVKDAIAEITLLRAGQFRWIAVSERLPTETDAGSPMGHVLFLAPGNSVVATGYFLAKGFTHWAPIPPLPERTQEEKDWEQYIAWCRSLPERPVHSVYDAFVAGLKAARGEK